MNRTALLVAWLALGVSSLAQGKLLDIGSSHACAVAATDGKVYCWGSDDSGQVGDGAPFEHIEPLPVVVQGLPAGSVRLVTTGDEHSCALMATGDAWCWGYDSYGQVGNDAAFNNVALAMPVMGGPAAQGKVFVDLAAGGKHTCGVDSGGGAWCWGSNYHGELGNDNALNDQPIPVAVSKSSLPAGRDFTHISAGTEHTCALDQTGAAWCWGSNQQGQLGTDLALTVFKLPVAVQSGATRFERVSAGYRHTCALDGEHRAWCWGDDYAGALGNDAAFLDSALPVPVAGDIAWSTIDTGVQTTCGIDRTGAPWCWGENGFGQTGDGTFQDRALPGRVTANNDLMLPADDIATGAGFTIAASNYGGQSAWLGSSGTGLFASGYSGIRVAPTPVQFAGTFQRLDLGADFACGADGQRRVWCWGDNQRGQLGSGSSVNGTYVQPLATPHTLPASPEPTLATGDEHACIVDDALVARCWGDNTHGQLGNGSVGTPAFSTVAMPVGISVLPAGRRFMQLTAGAEHTCALDDQQNAWCWGSNAFGQLGNGQAGADSAVPVAVAGGHQFTRLAAGNVYTCGIDASTEGVVFCWGHGSNGKLGQMSDTAHHASPVAVMGIPNAAVFDLVAGAAHTCAVTAFTGTQSRLSCWGFNGGGQIGNGTASDATTAIPVALVAGTGMTARGQVALGNDHTCAMEFAFGPNTASCWGGNYFGQLGTGNVTASKSPVASAGFNGALQLAGGSYFTCGVFADGSAKCSGYGADGRLGTGSVGRSNVPRRLDFVPWYSGVFRDGLEDD